MKTVQHIFGLQPIIEAIEAEEQIDKVYLQKGAQGVLFKDLEHLDKKK